MTHTDIILIFVAAMVLGAALMLVGMVLLMINKKSPEDYQDANTFFISYRDKNQVGLNGGEIRVYKYGELVNTISGRMADDIWKWLTEVNESGAK